VTSLPPGPRAIFVNEGAGSARSGRVRRTIELARRAIDADVHVTATRDVEELRAWLEEHIDGYRTAVIAGGDGSLGVGFNVAAGKDVTLGYIPAGFGNATAHLLRLPHDPERLVRLLAAGEAHSLDLVRVDGRLALFAGAGWDAVVADRYARAGARGLCGWASAVISSGRDLVRRHRASVEVDGKTIHDGPLVLLVVGTTPFYGRGLVVNPGADPAAGRLMARVYPGPAGHLALEAARWALHREPAATGYPGRRVVVESRDPIPLQADGDLIGARTRWEMELAPAAVRLIGR
jgi:diacylglycerol kinase (ATP)